MMACAYFEAIKADVSQAFLTNREGDVFQQVLATLNLPSEVIQYMEACNRRSEAEQKIK